MVGKGLARRSRNYRYELRRLVCIVAALVLAFGLVPVSALGAPEDGSAAGQRSESDIESSIAALLTAGDYVEGEAIVCSLPEAPSGSGGLSAQSANGGDLLGGAEALSTVTERQYAEAAGEVIPGNSETETEGSLSAQSVREDIRISLVRNDDLTTEELIRQLLADPRVLSAEPNYVMQLADDDGDTPTSAGAASQPSVFTIDRGLSTQASGETTYDMTGYQWSSQGAAATTPQYLAGATNPGLRVPNWNTPGAENASGVVAIMDSGVDHTHPDLKNVMYHFTDEQQKALGCGEYGYAPSRADHANTMDYLHHGTHCAGIVAAEWNGFGVSGVANGVEICAVSISDSETSSSDFSCDGIVKGFDFLVRAAESGVDIRAVNCSFEVTPTSNATAAVIQAAGEAGIVTCFASGNDGLNLETDYSDIVTKQQSPYMLRVNAARQQDGRAWFSNYGSYLTDVFSPGSGILSTIPTGVDDSWRYFPQADSSPLYKKTSSDDFNDKTALPYVYIEKAGSDGSTVLEKLDVSKASDIGVDGDSASLQFSIDITVGKRNAICIDVPAGSISDADIQDVGFALYLDSFEIRLVQTGIQLADGTYPVDGSRSDNSLYGWVMCGFHAPDSMSFNRVEHDGKSYLRLRFDALFNDPALEDFTVKKVDARLDQISIGKKGNDAYLPYCYMNGTSMATPAVTGCAAVVSTTVTAASPGERAVETVRILKGAMHQTEGYSGLCKQGGQVDLGILGQTDKYVPVIESGEVSGSTVTVKGVYFGDSAGTITVGGVAVQPSSWSSTEITAPWPNGVASGAVPVSVKSGAGQTTRAFMLSAPAGDSEHVDVYERDLVVPNVRADGLSITAYPYNLIADDDGVLYAVASNVDDQMDETTGYLFRSDDSGASWTPIALPQPLKKIALAAGDGTLYLLGATPAGSLQPTDFWHLYSYDMAKGTFALLNSYDAHATDSVMPHDGALAYVGGSLYVVDCHADDSDDGMPRMHIRKFDADYRPGDAVVLKHVYESGTPYYAPKVSVVGNSIYVCDFQRISSEEGHAYGLEHVDVADDGSISCTDLSSALAGLPDGVRDEHVCIAASDDGVYLVGNGLDKLLPEDAARTDTFFLEKGASAFAPYSRTLSLGPIFTPVAVCSGGWLYAFATSEYEEMPVFGRATKVAEDPEPGPDPAVSYAFTEGDGSSWTKGSTDGLPFTVKRSVDDSQTYGRFTGVQIDGKAVDASSYTAQAGSLVLTLKPELLETLSVGEHKLTALFDDGSAQAAFTVKAAPAKSASTGDAKAAPKAKAQATKTPSTGDALPAATIIALAVLAAAAAAASAWAARKRWLRR